MTYTTPRQTTLELTRIVNATPAEVFDVWLDVKSPGGPWFGAKRAIVEAKVDGLFCHCVGHQGRDWAHYGRFVTLDRPKYIEHTWVSEATRGIETVVSLTLDAQGRQSRVTLRHTGVPDDDFGHQHAEGWDHVLGAIESWFASQAR